MLLSLIAAVTCPLYSRAEEVHFIFADTIAEGEYYNWRCHTLHPEPTVKTPGDSIHLDYVSVADTIKIFTTPECRPNGCDSILEFRLYVAPHRTTVLPLIEYCENANPPYAVGDTILRDTFQTIYGCDSVVIQPITVYPKKETTLDPLEYCWDDNLPYAVGDTIIRDTLTTEHNCDSVVIQPITVYPKKETKLELLEYCWDDNLPYAVGDTIIRDTLSTSHSCDSIVIQPITVYPKKETTLDPLEYCWDDNLPYAVGDTIIRDTLTTEHNCDSIIIQPITVYPKKETKLELLEYCWDDNLPYAVGDTIIRDTLSTSHSCDSIVIQPIKVYPKKETTLQPLVYNEDETTYPVGVTIVRDTFSTSHGCDSITIQQIMVNALPPTPPTPSVVNVHRDTICVGESYLYDGQSLTAAGMYTYQSVTATGADYYDTLYLHVEQPTKAKVRADENVCADATEFYLMYSYTGPEPLSYTIRYDARALLQGFEDVYQEPITNNSQLYVPLMPSANRRDYPRPDFYEADIYFFNGICADSVATRQHFAFQVDYPSWLVEQQWNDVLTVLSDTVNGGYRFKAYQWYHNGEPMPGETREYIYCPHYLDFAEDSYYQVQLTREDDGQRIMTCPMTPGLKEGNITLQDDYLEVSPTLVNKVSPVVNIFTASKGSYQFYDAAGRLLFGGDIVPDEHSAMELILPQMSGTYFCRMRTEQGYMRVVKIMVY